MNKMTAAAKELFTAAAHRAHAAACAHRDAVGPEAKEATRLAYVAALNEETHAFQVFTHFATGNTHPFPR